MAAAKKILVIVESPSKAKTIGKFLGSRYKVIASVGHVRDLPKSKLGIDIENDFEPRYISIRGKGDIIKELKKEAKNASKVYLATDPDREGEAISWHLAFLLGIDQTTPCRIVFNEITEKAIKNAIKNPRPIDISLVDAQQARRVLDRLVGYQISPLLWRKIRRGLSAGRVQSAALKIICDRENEIKNFKPQEYWTITADFKKDRAFSAKLTEYKGKKLSIDNREQNDAILEELRKGSYTVTTLEEKDRLRRPMPPFTTSSLQQDAANKLNFTTKKTMMVAQQLYEGVEIKGRGTVGLVSYIRTDSVRISDEARDASRAFITENFGKEYYAGTVYSNKKKDIQDAHEAIRPSHMEIVPDSIVCNLIHIYEILCLFFAKDLPGVLYFDFLRLHPLRRHVAEYIADGNAHSFVAHIQLIGLRCIRHLYLYILFFEKSLSQLLSHLFPCKLCVHAFALQGCLLLLLLLVLLFLAHISAVSKYEVEWSSAFAGRRLFLSRYYRFDYLFLYDLVGN